MGKRGASIWRFAIGADIIRLLLLSQIRFMSKEKPNYTYLTRGKGYDN